MSKNYQDFYLIFSLFMAKKNFQMFFFLNPSISYHPINNLFTSDWTND